MKKKSQSNIPLWLCAIVLGIAAIFIIKTMVWDDPDKRWIIQDLYFKEDPNTKLTLASPIRTFSQIVGIPQQPQSTTIDDASKMNQTAVAGVYQPQSTAEIQQLIQLAKTTDHKISVSGVRHSMGGQAFAANAIQLDMTKFDGVTYNSDGSVTAQSGATWKQIQNVLDPKGRAVVVMQDSNIFTVGGSLSVNVHGKDPRFSTLISTVNWFKIMTPDGHEILCSRQSNPELFSAAVGGYGLFGVITEVNLQTVPNDIYLFQLQPVSTDKLLNTFEQSMKDPDINLIEAHLSISKNNLLSQALLYTYKKAGSNPQSPSDTSGENSIWLRKAVFQITKSSDFGQLIRWEIEKDIEPLIETPVILRNTAMAAPVRFLENPDPTTSDILQEYFIPKNRFDDFVGQYKNLLQKYNVHLLNVTVRYVPKNTENVLSYAQDDMYGFVAYYKVDHQEQDLSGIKNFTSAMMDDLNQIKGTYYLCYGNYYTLQQLTTMYPNITKLFALKTKYDPAELFSNSWYQTLKTQN